MFKSHINGIYIPSINSFFVLIEKNANTSLRAWAVLNFCDNEDIVKETKNFLEKGDAQGFSTFFIKTAEKTNGNLGKDIKYCELSRGVFNELLDNGCVFFGLLRDPVERAMSVYNDKLERIISEDEQLVLGGKNSKHTREKFIERLRTHVGSVNLVKRLYSDHEHVIEYIAHFRLSWENQHYTDRHLDQQFELISPIAELMMSHKFVPKLRGALFLLDCKDACQLDRLIKSLTGYETNIKMEKIKLRQTKEKVVFTKAEKKELSNILISDYEFMHHAKQFLYSSDSDI